MVLFVLFFSYYSPVDLLILNPCASALLQALGDYTRMINDFSVLPSNVREGRVGSYWYHEDTQAFFDDMDHYKMIKAMCRLSCSICDKMEGQPQDGSKRRANIRNIEQLKGHLFHQHKLVMCSLCLEGRKVKCICLTSSMILGDESLLFMVCMRNSLASFV